MITISGVLKYKAETDVLPTEDKATRFMQQIADDAIYGTFGTFPPYWNNAWQRPPSELARASVEQQEQRIFRFSLQLSEDFFAIKSAGLQHLIGVLAGDLFYLEVPDSQVESIDILEVTPTDAMTKSAIELFRNNRAHSIEELRSLFALKRSEPLLAFSFKPRVGVKLDTLRDVSLKVLSEGFHLVELDTRYLTLDTPTIAFLLELARDAAKLGKEHVTRFSPNLSVPATSAIDLTEQFLSVQPDPAVIKIDGGLDGISSCQEVRKRFGHDEAEQVATRRRPVITCYPLLRNQLSGRVPPKFFVLALALSGVDIMYPGNRPSVGLGDRTLAAGGSGGLINAVNWYRSLIRANWPMPTIAGGIYAGELHAFYELLGPRAAYFLGGAVALHKGGPVEGAKLCVATIREAIRARRPKVYLPELGTTIQTDETSHDEYVDDLDGSLVTEMEEAYARSTQQQAERFGYVSPRRLLQDTPGLNSWFALDS